MKLKLFFGKLRWLWILGAVVSMAAGSASAEVLVDHTCTNIHDIPAVWVEAAKTDLHVVYQHTSHGSQLISGMNALEAHPVLGGTYKWDDSGDPSEGLDLDDYGIPGCADLSQGDVIVGGVTPWVTATRELLNNATNYHINVVMWSWCSINNHNAQRYVDNMEILIAEYGPGGTHPRAAQYPVDFVFMTGHAEGQGELMVENNVHYNNELIRAHCLANDRILFDFADIEAYDPDGNYYWDQAMRDNLDYSGGGNWAVEWLAANPGSELDELTTGNGIAGYSGCSYCAHSDSPREATLNCVLKGRAAWWLMARLAGWDPGGNNANRAPVLSAIGNKSIEEGSELTFTVSATDPDGDTLEYAATNLPTGASFDPGTRIFRWTPGAGHVGAHDVTITVTDSGTPPLSDAETFTITVNEIPSENHAPVFSPVADRTVLVGEEVSITFQATDPDGDTLEYSATSLPAGASFDTGTATFLWTPGVSDVGNFDVSITVTDNGTPPLSASETVTITVNDRNHAPVFSPVADRAVQVGEEVSITFQATDPDGDALEYSATNMPAGASFDTRTATFLWTPGVGDVGSSVVSVTVTDNGTPPLSATETVTITVTALPSENHAPVFSPVADRTVLVGEEVSITFQATDADGDTLEYSAASLPAGASFDTGTATFQWIPDAGDVGNTEVSITVTDNGTPPLSDTATVTITVNALPGENHAPVMSPVADRTVQVGEEVIITFQATDADGDTLEYSATSLPVGASFDTSTATLQWIPDVGDVGNTEVSITVTDNGTPPLSDTATVTITVNALPSENHAPVISPVADRTVQVGEEVIITFQATDADGDTLEYSATSLPAGASFDAGTATFQWIPGVGDVGSSDVRITVTDNGTPPLSDTATVTITVNDIPGVENHAPVISSAANRTVEVGEELSITFQATDPDGDALEYSATGLPTGASFDAGTATFLWTPGVGDVGNHHVSITVTDNGTPPLSDTETIIITVNESPGGENHAPEISPVANRTVQAGHSINITFQASDPDGDRISCSLEDMPEGAIFDEVALTFTWRPQTADRGIHDMVFTVTDDGNPSRTASQTVTITVVESRDSGGSDSDEDAFGDGMGCFIVNLIQ